LENEPSMFDLILAKIKDYATKEKYYER